MLTFRNATIDDLELFFKWVNDPAVRETAVNPKIISLEEHTIWFTKKIQDKSSLIYVFEKDKFPIGQVRFDKHNNTFLISYSITVDQRGNGYGSQILQQAIVNIYLNENNIYELFEGYVDINNSASRKIFESIGFLNLGEVNFSNRMFVHYGFLKKKIKIDYIMIGKKASNFQRLQSSDQVYEYIRVHNTKVENLLPSDLNKNEIKFELIKAQIESGNIVAHVLIL